MDIMLVGEAYGETEAALRMPFMGPAGHELNGELEDASISRSDCAVSNVFNFRPKNNDIKTICCTKKEETLNWPPLATGQYLREEYAPELDRLYGELEQYAPNIIIALGGTALWALTGLNGISKYRGTVRYASPLRPTAHKRKIIATFHPAAVLRQYALRPIVIADLMKAKRQSAFPEVKNIRREIYIEPSLEDIERFYREWIIGAKYLAVDIETAQDLVTCIGFAPSPYRSLVIPFWDPRRGGNYWPTGDYERQAWGAVRRILHSHVPKVFQNGLYDIHWLWKQCGIAPRNCQHDTMLLAHALHPELQKGLAFLASVYADAPAWKAEFKTRTWKKEA
jgi:uracil-DNA glycosylase